MPEEERSVQDITREDVEARMAETGFAVTTPPPSDDKTPNGKRIVYAAVGAVIVALIVTGRSQGRK